MLPCHSVLLWYKIRRTACSLLLQGFKNKGLLPLSVIKPGGSHRRPQMAGLQNRGVLKVKHHFAVENAYWGVTLILTTARTGSFGTEEISTSQALLKPWKRRWKLTKGDERESSSSSSKNTGWLTVRNQISWQKISQLDRTRWLTFLSLE